jgi:hypothetical protein
MLRRVITVHGILLAVGLVACGSATSGARAPRNFPSYDPHSAQLFDDGIDADAVGLTQEHEDKPATDMKLRERAQVGDAVVRARVTTVNEDTAKNWQLEFQTVQVLHVGGVDRGRSAPTTPYDSAFTLMVEPTDPSFGIVNSMMSHLIGHTFVVFLRSFAHGMDARPGDEPDLHFHVATDSKDVSEAIRSAIVLGEVQ